jgi:hypothetical protein
MILQRLAEHYNRIASAGSDAPIAPYGFSMQKMSFCVVLEPDGWLDSFQSLQEQIGKRLVAPHLMVPGQSKPSGSGLNPCFLWDNAAYMLGYKPDDPAPERTAECFEAFRKRHLDAEQRVGNPAFSAVCAFLRSWSPEKAQEHSTLLSEITKNFGVFRLAGESGYVHEGVGARGLKRLTELGVKHVQLQLEAGGRKLWRYDSSCAWQCVEEAALAYFIGHGWMGHAQERSLILSLIKAASLPEIKGRSRGAVVEALYAQNVCFEEDRFEKAWLLKNILVADAVRIESNFEAMISETLCVYPTLTLSKMLGLYAALGNERLHAIARLFAKAPYTQRSGWPDLTLWRGQDVVFKEVKAPGDELQGSQERIIATILRPLGYDVELVEIIPK